ncbi:MAG: OmpH family outer membrane protein [Muribaculaceae bacterium]|nr:OmpH family outer membrane protein [Muribaculaceae bacterium]
MKKYLVMAVAAIAVILAMPHKAQAQKFALVDMEYVLSNYPPYEMANETVNKMSKAYQDEVDALTREAQDLYKKYQSEMVFLTDQQKKDREAVIVAKEKSAAELQNKYFGPQGALFQTRQKLMTPVQEEVYNAVKKVAEERGYQCIFDRASASDIIFASPRIDVSDEVLSKLGYSR